MRISDWSSDVCSSDLRIGIPRAQRFEHLEVLPPGILDPGWRIFQPHDRDGKTTAQLLDEGDQLAVAAMVEYAVVEGLIGVVLLFQRAGVDEVREALRPTLQLPDPGIVDPGDHLLGDRRLEQGPDP